MLGVIFSLLKACVCGSNCNLKLKIMREENYFWILPLLALQILGVYIISMKIPQGKGAPPSAAPLTPLEKSVAKKSTKSALSSPFNNGMMMESCACRCFDGATCSHYKQVQQFLALDLDIKDLRITGAFPLNLTLDTNSNSKSNSKSKSKSKSNSSPGPTGSEPPTSSVFVSVLKDTETVLDKFRAQINSKTIEIESPVGANSMNFFEATTGTAFGGTNQPLLGGSSRPATADVSSLPAGSGISAVRNIDNNDDNEHPVSMFQSRFFPQPSPPLSRFSDRPSTAPGKSAKKTKKKKKTQDILSTAAATTTTITTTTTKTTTTAIPTPLTTSSSASPLPSPTPAQHQHTLSPTADYNQFGTPKLRLANTIHTFAKDEIGGRDANSELLLSELIAQTYRLIQKTLPWQAQMCPRAFEDMEILRQRFLSKFESNLLVGYKKNESATQKNFLEDETTSINLFKKEETQR